MIEVAFYSSPETLITRSVAVLENKPDPTAVTSERRKLKRSQNIEIGRVYIRDTFSPCTSFMFDISCFASNSIGYSFLIVFLVLESGRHGGP